MPTEAPAVAGAIVITGASAGLGAALAREYAAPGRFLVLIGRREGALNSVAESCRAAGAVVETGLFDVRDDLQTKRFLAEVDQRRPIELMIVNAGLFSGIGQDGALETGTEVRELLRTNLEAAILNTNAVADLMRPRGRGRIALITSLAARQPLADAPAYSASKAGLVAYGEALRERLAPEGVNISLVLPGHIETAQVAHHRGELPLMMSAEDAAQRICRRLGAGATTIAFPLALVWLIALGRFLPWRLRALAGQSLRFTVDDPSRDGR